MDTNTFAELQAKINTVTLDQVLGISDLDLGIRITTDQALAIGQDRLSSNNYVVLLVEGL
jgi:hypothetical protein